MSSVDGTPHSSISSAVCASLNNENFSEPIRRDPYQYLVTTTDISWPLIPNKYGILWEVRKARNLINPPTTLGAFRRELEVMGHHTPKRTPTGINTMKKERV
ncbi:hypothetical protein Trydic_g1138 [Trypoxylus dichotomus]